MTRRDPRNLSRVGALLVLGVSLSNLYAGSLPHGNHVKALLLLALVGFALHRRTRRLQISRLSPIFVVATAPLALELHSGRIDTNLEFLQLVVVPMIAIATARTVVTPSSSQGRVSLFSGTIPSFCISVSNQPTRCTEP